MLEYDYTKSEGIEYSHHVNYNNPSQWSILRGSKRVLYNIMTCLNQITTYMRNIKDLIILHTSTTHEIVYKRKCNMNMRSNHGET